jgi:hypothetical protein
MNTFVSQFAPKILLTSPQPYYTMVFAVVKRNKLTAYEKISCTNPKNSCIISDMDRKKLTKILNNQTLIIWDNLCELYPRLTKYNPPIIELNGRLYRTAGMCQQEHNIIQLGYKFFLYSPDYAKNMIDTILPHEIIHQADYNLFGESEAKCGHGKYWREIMVKYGLSPDKYHQMWIK